MKRSVHPIWDVLGFVGGIAVGVVAFYAFVEWLFKDAYPAYRTTKGRPVSTGRP